VASKTSDSGRSAAGSKKNAAKTSAQARIASQRAAQQKQDRRRNLFVTGGTILGVIIIVAVIVVVGVNSKSKSSSGSGNAVVAASSTLTSDIKAAAATNDTPDFTKVALAPKSTNGAALTSAGKPEVLYVGAEYCPYCAATRWPLTVALSRFGSFSGLDTTYSSDSDSVGPHTPTLSFRDATYTSSYISFVSREQEDGLGKPLQTLTTAENTLFSSLGGSSYPFIDFGNKWYQHGSIYDPAILKGLTPDSVASQLTSTGTVGATISASADILTAAICKIDGNTPAAVCNAKGVLDAGVALVAASAAG
jgi:hypothetical protein